MHWTTVFSLLDRLSETEVELVELRIAMETKRQREGLTESSEGENSTPPPSFISHTPCFGLQSGPQSPSTPQVLTSRGPWSPLEQKTRLEKHLLSHLMQTVRKMKAVLQILLLHVIYCSEATQDVGYPAEGGLSCCLWWQYWAHSTFSIQQARNHSGCSLGGSATPRLQWCVTPNTFHHQPLLPLLLLLLLGKEDELKGKEWLRRADGDGTSLSGKLVNLETELRISQGRVKLLEVLNPTPSCISFSCIIMICRSN